jgi:hypothetical protein
MGFSKQAIVLIPIIVLVLERTSRKENDYENENEYDNDPYSQESLVGA